MSDPSETEIYALHEALGDEHRAWAKRDEVIRDFGAVRPFINTPDAEARHIEALRSLLPRDDIPLAEKASLRRRRVMRADVTPVRRASLPRSRTASFMSGLSGAHAGRTSWRYSKIFRGPRNSGICRFPTAASSTAQERNSYDIFT